MKIRAAATAAITVTTLLAATACASGPVPSPDEQPHTTPTIQHIHALAFSSDGDLLVGSHDGVFSINIKTKKSTLVGDVEFDAMGLTAQGDTLYVSGHPGADTHDEFAAPHIGLVKHTPDTGWEQIALAGTTDFHALSTSPADPDLVLGIPSDRAVLLRSSDAGLTFTEVSELSARALSIDSVDSAVVTATTAEGLVVSRDGGDSFSPLAGPTLVVVTADPTRQAGLIGVAPDGGLWVGSSEPDANWASSGTIDGGASALTVNDDGVIAVASESGVIVSQDGGSTWTTLIAVG